MEKNINDVHNKNEVSDNKNPSSNDNVSLNEPSKLNNSLHFYSVHKKNDAIKDIAPFLNLGLQMAITIGAFALLGWWIDGKFNYTPIFTLILSLLGIAVALFTFIRTVIKNEPDNNKSQNKKTDSNHK
jgi:F0F1-type ATP synthase assembly protein I